MALSKSSLNRAALDQFIRLQVCEEIVSYLADKARAVVRPDPSSSHLDGDPLPDLASPSSTSTPDLATPPSTPTQPTLPPLEAFIQHLADGSHVSLLTLTSSLVYLSRLQKRLSSKSIGLPCASHRLFLTSLILADKNLNDESLYNKKWSRLTKMNHYEWSGFDIAEVTLMERQFLLLFDWQVRITDEDLFTHLDPFLAPIRVRLMHDDFKSRAQDPTLQKMYSMQIDSVKI